MKIRVAIIIERTNISLGGAERSVRELKDKLLDLGIEVEILAAEGCSSDNEVQILCSNNRNQRTNYTTFYAALKKHLEVNNYDIIHSVLPFDFADIYQPRGGSFAETIQQNIASYSNSLVCTYKRLTAFANKRRRIMLEAERALCTHTNGPTIATLSKYVATQFREHYGLSQDRIVIIKNGVKTDRKINKEESARFEDIIYSNAEIHNSNNATLFLFAANNFRLKGLGQLIEALKESEKLNPLKTPYLIVAGRDKTNKYINKVKKLGLTKRVIFLGAVDNIQNLLAITDVAVLATFYDPSSRFILEALAAGKPVITTKFNGAIDLFVEDVHGKIIESPNDIKELGKAIAYFSNDDNIDRCAKAIKEDSLKEQISIDRAAKELISLYKEIIEKRKK